MKTLPVVVIGGGLAGAEAAYQIACRGLPVQLYEMRPLGSVVLQAADASRVPAGAALAVDRLQFAQHLTTTIGRHPNITLIRQEVVALSEEQLTIVATGPLTSPALTAHLQDLLGGQHLYFYDALSPIVAADSIDQSKTFFASRYDIGDGDDYLNCPLDHPTYEAFCTALVAATCVQPHAFEREIFFEGCLPIEEMARRGPQTLAFGPLKPVGLRHSDRSTPYAVVQLRLEDTLRRAYNMVGFQTRLTYAEQRRVFRMIPGLEQAEFLRLGAVHRNTFLNAPRLLLPTLQTRHEPMLLFAGQITGVEGYIESAATGLLAGLNAVALHCGRPLLVPPPTTAHGALVRYISAANPDTFQPMNIHFGLLPPLETPTHPKKARRAAMIARALADLQAWHSSVYA